MTETFNSIKYIVTYISQTLNLFSPQAKKEGRPLAIKQEDALAFALYKHRSTRATKKSVYDDFNLKDICSYKTFVVSIQRMGIYALRILFFIMRMGRKDGHLVKYTDATDLPVCLNKNAVKHKTMKGLAAWGQSGKGFYYGLKMTMTRDDDGRLIALAFSPANGNDRTIFRKVNKDVNGIIVADAGYVSKELEREMTTDKRMILIKPYKNMKKIATAWQLFLYNRRFKIEFDFRNLKLFHGLVSSLPRSVDGYIGNYLFALLSFVIV
ncbi:MAG: transposase [Nitrososphaera sp.]|nr:transposase [Nitrososphaera sp.]